MLKGSILDAINPYSLYLKLAGAAIIAILLGLLLWSWHSRGLKIEALTSWQTSVVTAVTDATVEPGKDGKRKMLTPEGALAGIGTLKTSLDNALVALRDISKLAQDAKSRADAADKQLADEMAAFEKRYAAATRRISALEARKPAATAGEALIAIDGDSKAAWEGWR
jgi:hypothetical protein